MIRRPRTYLAVAAVAAVSCGGPKTPRRLDRPADISQHALVLPKASRFSLANGTRVVVATDEASNLVGVDVRYEVGSVEDPPGKAGLAHVVEHMSFELGPEAPFLDDRLAAVALYYNAYTSFDETHYTAVAMRDQLEDLLALEGARMRASCDQLDATVFEREREVIKSELRQRTTLASQVSDTLRTAVYGPDHPYTRSVAGTEADLDAITLDDVCWFITTYYAPERAIVVVTGNVDQDAVRRKVDAAFGDVLPRPTPVRRHVPAPMVTQSNTRHELPVVRASALIATPAPVFADREGAFGRTLTALFEGVVQGELSDLDYIASFEVGRIGGARAPVHVAAISVDDPARLKDAVKAFFRARAEVQKRLSKYNVPSESQRKAAGQIRAYEAIGRRGSILADYAQYGPLDMTLASHVRWMRAATVGYLARRADQYFDAEHSHVAYVYPTERGKATDDSASFEQTSATYDVGQWQTPVDEGEQAVDLPMPSLGMDVTARQVRLPNGMKVLLAGNLPYPLVDIRLVFPVGSMHDPADKPGVADLTARFLLPSSQSVYWGDDLAFLEQILTMGGDPAVHVTETTTTFRVRGLAIHTEGFVWQLGWLLDRGELSGDVLELYRELLEKADDDDDRRAQARSKAIRVALFGADHPYARTVAAREEAKRIGLSDLRAFRQRYYRPDDAVLVVAGQFDVDDIEHRIREQYGAWRSGGAKAPTRSIPPARRRTRAQYFGHVDDDAGQITIAFAYATAPGRGRTAARTVLAEMIDHRMQALRERLAATYGISVSQSYSAGPGFLLVGGAIDASQSGQALNAMRAAMADLRAGVDAGAAFARARRAVFRRALAQTMSAATVASHLVAAARGEVDRGGLGAFAREVAGLRPADVQAIIDAELRETDGIVFVSGPRKVVEDTYAAAQLRDVTYLD